MKKWLFCLLSMLLFQPLPAYAPGGNPPLRDVLPLADFICRGKVLAIHKGDECTAKVSRTGVEISAGSWPVIQMSADFAVEKVFKGKLANPNIKIEYWQDNRKSRIGGAFLLYLREDETCYLFLKQSEGKDFFQPATPFGTSKHNFSGRTGTVGQSFLFEREGPWMIHSRKEYSNFGEEILIPAQTIQGFKTEYTEALQVEKPTEVGFEIMRAMSVTIIGLSRNRSCLPFLTKVLKNDSSPLVRRQAAYALKGQRGPAEVVYSLIRALRKDSEASCRKVAAEALGEFEGPTAAGALARAIREDADPAVRLSALGTLKWMMRKTRQADITKHIISIRDALLIDPDENIRLGAIDAMNVSGVFCTISASKKQDNGDEQQFQTGKILYMPPALKKQWKDAQIIPALRKSLNDSSPRVVLKAFSALEDMTRAPVLPQLVAMLKGELTRPEIPDPAYPIFVIASEQFQNDPLKQKESLKLVEMVMEISPTPELAYACAEFYKRYGFQDRAEEALALAVKLQAGRMTDAK